MPRIRVRGLGAGLVMGAAAVIRVSRGIAVPPDPPAATSASLAKPRAAERLDVVLVSESYETGLALVTSIAWANVVGIVAATCHEFPLITSIPAVIAPDSVIASIQPGSLILLDAGRGLLLVDPDAMAIAAFQAESANIAPKRRIYIESQHLPARTEDQVEISVAALVRTESDAAVALAEGADAIYIPADSELFATPMDAQMTAASVVARLSAGKPLVLGDAPALDAISLLVAAVEADIALAARLPETDPGGAAEELVAEWKEAQIELDREEKACCLPTVCGLLPGLPPEANLEEWLDNAVAADITQFVLSFEDDVLDDQSALPLDRFMTAARTRLCRVTVAAHRHAFNPFGTGHTEDSLVMALKLLLGTGATSVLVLPSQVAESKAIIRTLCQGDCREDLLRGEL